MSRAARYAKVAGAAAGVAGHRLFGQRDQNAAVLRAALGGLKGPLMKVAQLLASIPDFLPPAYAAELMTLQADAPSMGWPFVRRRMAAELGPDWQSKFDSFEKDAAAAASLGQVHRAVSLGGQKLACKLQYPDMDSIVEADLRQLKLILSLFERFDGAVSTKEAFEEIAERLREELDYEREARNIALYARMLKDVSCAHVPAVIPELSTSRLLCMEWLEGEKLVEVAERRSQEERNQIAINMFRVWYEPFYRYGVLHGDPHLGNYTIREDGSVNLLDFGCIRVFEPRLIHAVILMFEALREDDKEKESEAFRLWGFKNLSKESREALRLWARFVYAPLLQEGVRSIEETNATLQGRETARKVYESLKRSGQVAIPREFVMIDRASIGLGGVFLRLRAKVDWHALFTDMIRTYALNVTPPSIKEKEGREGRCAGGKRASSA